MLLSEINNILNEVNDIYIYPFLESTDSFRKLAKQYHPDAPNGDAEIFKAIMSAKSDEQFMDELVQVLDNKEAVVNKLKLKGYMKVDDKEDSIKNELNDNNSPKYEEALKNQYALTQVYKQNLDTVMNKSNSDILSNVEVEELLALLNEWENSCITFYEKDYPQIKEQEEQIEYRTLVDKTKKNIEDSLEDVKYSKVKRKSNIMSILGKTWNLFKNILDAKLPKGLIQAIAYSNPISALIADNWDLVSNVYGVAKDTVSKVIKK